MAAVDDLKTLLALIPGGQAIDQKLADFETYIQTQAGIGAKAAVQPYVFAALGLAGLALLVALGARRAALAPRGSAGVGGARRVRFNLDHLDSDDRAAYEMALLHAQGKHGDLVVNKDRTYGYVRERKR